MQLTRRDNLLFTPVTLTYQGTTLEARVGWSERSEVQQPSGLNVGVRFAHSNLRGLGCLGKKIGLCERWNWGVTTNRVVHST
jgi:hypothetical protein